MRLEKYTDANPVRGAGNRALYRPTKEQEMQVTVTVWRVKAGTFKPATLRPIGGENPQYKMIGGNKPSKRIRTPIATLIVGAAKYNKRWG